MSDTDNVTAVKLFRDNLIAENVIAENDIVKIKVDAKSIGKLSEINNLVLNTMQHSVLAVSDMKKCSNEKCDNMWGLGPDYGMTTVGAEAR